MTAFTSKSAGNWSASGQTTWTEAGVPADGDTVTITHTIVVDANTTIGASGAAASVAIQMNSGGSLTINTGIRLILRGDLVLNGTTLTIAAGGSLRFDSSAAEGTPIYRVLSGATAGAIVASGTSGSRCTIDTAAGSGVGHIGATYDKRLNISLAYTDLISLGDVSAVAFGTATNASITTALASGDYLLLDHCTFDLCGQVFLYGSNAASRIEVTSCRLLSSLAAAWTKSNASAALTFFNFSLIANKTTGTRIFQDNVIALPDYDVHVVLSPQNASNYNKGWTVERNVFNSVDCAYFETWEDNLLYGRTSYWSFVGVAADTMTDTYVVQDSVLGSDGGYFALMEMEAQLADGTVIFDGTIWDFTSPYGQLTHVVDAASPTRTYTEYRRAITLPTPAGKSPGYIYGRDLTKTALQLSHCTLMATDLVSRLRENCAVYVNNSAGAGYVPFCRNNLVWAKAAASTYGYKWLLGVDANGPATADVYTGTGLHHNAFYNCDTGTIYDEAGNDGITVTGYGSGGVGKMKVTDHDTVVAVGDVDLGTGTDETASGPKFVDSSRNFATADIACFGNSAATAWADATGYVVGDIRSAATLTWYGNATINYRCIKAHTSDEGHATNGKPGEAAATAYRTNWEFATAYRIRLDTSKIATLYAWVECGFGVKESSLNNAGSDGVTIGAGDYVPQQFIALQVGSSYLVMGV